MTKWTRHGRTFFDCERDLQLVRAGWPQEPIIDISRGEQRLAAEIALAELRGCITPSFAHERAVQILSVLASA